MLTQRLFLAEQTQHRGLHSHYLATELLLELASTATRGRTEADSSNAALCQKIKDFVKRHPFCEVRVSTVAQELGYHEKYLSAVFRQTEGMTLKSYLSLERTKDIKRLLCVPEYSVAQVAAMLEFSDPHHLSRFFKAQTGMTPTEFKNAMRE